MLCTVCFRTSFVASIKRSLACRSFSVKASSPKVIRLTETPAEYTATGPVLGGDVGNIISGAPSTKTAIQHTGGVKAGLWECEPGKWSHVQSGDEYITLLEGSMILESADGHTESYSAPDSFVIPDGWEGTWEVTARIRKFFAVRGQ